MESAGIWAEPRPGASVGNESETGRGGARGKELLGRPAASFPRTDPCTCREVGSQLVREGERGGEQSRCPCRALFHGCVFLSDFIVNLFI